VTGKEFHTPKWGPEKNCDLKTRTEKELCISEIGPESITGSNAEVHNAFLVLILRVTFFSGPLF
jgi:hypothetical protein